MPLCRSNACVASTQYDYGNSAKLADANTESANYLTVQQITVNYRTSLLRFGVWGRDAIHTPNVVMAIYADSGGTPGAFVASSIPVAIASGAVEAPVGSATNLMPGKYWIGGVYSATADTSWSMSSGPTAYYVMNTYPATPNPFPTAGRMTFSGYTYNYYIVVQDY
jgi:hypothetical protein